MKKESKNLKSITERNSNDKSQDILNKHIANKSNINKILKALKLIKKYVGIKEDTDEIFQYSIVDKQYYSSRSCVIISKKEYKIIKEILEINEKDLINDPVIH